MRGQGLLEAAKLPCQLVDRCGRAGQVAGVAEFFNALSRIGHGTCAQVHHRALQPVRRNTDLVGIAVELRCADLLQQAIRLVEEGRHHVLEQAVPSGAPADGLVQVEHRRRVLGGIGIAWRTAF